MLTTGTAGRPRALRRQRARHRRAGRRRRHARRPRRRHRRHLPAPPHHAIPSETADQPAFVALLHGTLDQVQDVRPRTATRRSGRSRSSASTTTRAINGRLSVLRPRRRRLLRQPTTTAPSPRSTAAPATTRSRSARSTAPSATQTLRRACSRRRTSSAPSPPPAAGSAPATARRSSPSAAPATTRSPSTPTRPTLRLEGDDGDDTFTVRAFALAETTGNCSPDVNDPSCQIVFVPIRSTRHGRSPGRGWRSGFSTAAETEIRTGAGQQPGAQYNINAPVSIDGGNGFDRVVVLGTEFADHIVVTAEAIYGAGPAVTFRGVEMLEIDDARGRRHDRRAQHPARRGDAGHRRPRQRPGQRGR